MTANTSTEQLHQLLELVLTELDRKAIPVAYMQEIDRKGKAFIEQAARRAPSVPVPQSIEQMAVDRYKVVPSHSSVFYPCAVVAGDGQQQLYIGRAVECQNMARKFTGAFLDGAFVALAAAPQPPEAAPEGWALVPLEATQEMIEAWGNATELPEGMVERSDDEVNAYAAQRDWKAMLAVAPAVVVVPDERSAFEAWAESVGLDHLERGFGKQDDYAFVETRRMWVAWQGRAALAATPAAPMKEE